MDLLADKLTRSELQCWGSSSKGATDLQVGTKLYGFRERAGGASFSQTEVLIETILPLLSPPTA